MRLNAICSYMFVYVQLHKPKHNRTYAIAWNKLAWYSANIWNKLASYNLIFQRRIWRYCVFYRITLDTIVIFVYHARLNFARARAHATRTVAWSSSAEPNYVDIVETVDWPLTPNMILGYRDAEMCRKCEDRFCGSHAPPPVRLCTRASSGSIPAGGYARVRAGDGGQTPNPRNKPGCPRAVPWRLYAAYRRTMYNCRLIAYRLQCFTWNIELDPAPRGVLYSPTVGG